MKDFILCEASQLCYAFLDMMNGQLPLHRVDETHKQPVKDPLYLTGVQVDPHHRDVMLTGRHQQTGGEIPEDSAQVNKPWMIILL